MDNPNMKTTTTIFYFIIIALAGMLCFCHNDNNQNTGAKNIETEKTKKEQTSTHSSLPNNRPRLIVKGSAHRDLGKIQEGIEKHVYFTLVNTGSAEAAPISIHDLSQGGCTAVSVVSKLAPGDSARLEFIFKTLGYGDRTVTRKVKVRFNNPKLSPLVLSTTGTIFPTEPYQVPIGELYYNFFVLVDVRSPNVFAREHIAGAINVPEEELAKWLTQLPKDFLIYLYSQDGQKSDRLAQRLRKSGYSQCMSMVGGIWEWENRYGKRFLISGIH